MHSCSLIKSLKLLVFCMVGQQFAPSVFLCSCLFSPVTSLILIIMFFLIFLSQKFFLHTILALKTIGIFCYPLQCFYNTYNTLITLKSILLTAFMDTCFIFSVSNFVRTIWTLSHACDCCNSGSPSA